MKITAQKLRRRYSVSLELENGLIVVDPCAYSTRAKAVESGAELLLFCWDLKAE